MCTIDEKLLSIEEKANKVELNNYIASFGKVIIGELFDVTEIDKIVKQEIAKEFEKLYNKELNEFMFGNIPPNLGKSSKRMSDEWNEQLKNIL